MHCIVTVLFFCLQLPLGLEDFLQDKVFVFRDALGGDDQYQIAVARDLVFVVGHELARVPEPFAVLGMDLVPIDGHVDRLLHLGGNDRPHQRALGQRGGLVPDGRGVHERVPGMVGTINDAVRDRCRNATAVQEFLVGHALVFGREELWIGFLGRGIIIARVLEGLGDLVGIVGIRVGMALEVNDGRRRNHIVVVVRFRGVIILVVGGSSSTRSRRKEPNRSWSYCCCGPLR